MISIPHRRWFAVSSIMVASFIYFVSQGIVPSDLFVQQFSSGVIEDKSYSSQKPRTVAFHFAEGTQNIQYNYPEMWRLQVCNLEYRGIECVWFNVTQDEWESVSVGILGL